MDLIRPTEPSKDDCCNSGCNPCIFEVYEKQLKIYENSSRKGTDIIRESLINSIMQLKYTKFVVMENRRICKSHNLLAFNIDAPNKNGLVWWNPGDHFLYKYCNEDKRCTRAYTPLILKNYQSEDKKFDFMIIVKNYNNNSVSSHLCSLEIGQKTLWRGPYGSYTLIANKFTRIIMIAQGTGIVPFYSIIEQILNNEDDFTKIVLLFCCHSQAILLREELYDFSSYWNFSYTIFLSGNFDIINKKYKEPLENYRLNNEQLKKTGPFTLNDQVLICGSATFMNMFSSQINKEGIPWDNIVTF